MEENVSSVQKSQRVVKHWEQANRAHLKLYKYLLAQSHFVCFHFGWVSVSGPSGVQTHSSYGLTEQPDAVWGANTQPLLSVLSVQCCCPRLTRVLSLSGRNCSFSASFDHILVRLFQCKLLQIHHDVSVSGTGLQMTTHTSYTGHGYPFNRPGERRSCHEGMSINHFQCVNNCVHNLI